MSILENSLTTNNFHLLKEYIGIHTTKDIANIMDKCNVNDVKPIDIYISLSNLYDFIRCRCLKEERAFNELTKEDYSNLAYFFGKQSTEDVENIIKLKNLSVDLDSMDNAVFSLYCVISDICEQNNFNIKGE